MNDIAKSLWAALVVHDVPVPPAEEEREALRARHRDLRHRLMTWEGSGGTVAMPAVAEVCDLAADLARLNVRASLADIAGGFEPRDTLPLTGLRPDVTR